VKRFIGSQCETKLVELSHEHPYLSFTSSSSIALPLELLHQSLAQLLIFWQLSQPRSTAVPLVPVSKQYSKPVLGSVQITGYTDRFCRSPLSYNCISYCLISL
jgi:hypothetical protein